jgi:hypothetical protein
MISDAVCGYLFFITTNRSAVIISHHRFSNVMMCIGQSRPFACLASCVFFQKLNKYTAQPYNDHSDDPHEA